MLSMICLTAAQTLYFTPQVQMLLAAGANAIQNKTFLIAALKKKTYACSEEQQRIIHYSVVCSFNQL